MWFSITLSGNSCSFHILSLNNCANPFTNVSFAIVTKYVILNKLLQTTRIISFPATNSNLVMKSTIQVCPQFLWYFTQLQLPYWYLYSVLYPLTHITPVHIFFHIPYYSRPPVVSYHQLYYLLSFSMSCYQYIVI